MKDEEFIKKMVKKGEEASERVKNEFAGLNVQQLDWKPSPGVWSIGQCLDHLVTSNSLYFLTFREIVRGEYRMTNWQRWNPLGIFFGRMLVNQMSEDVKRKVITPKVFRPSENPIDIGVVDRFLKHQDTLLDLIDACRRVDLDKTQITSPVSKVVTYSLRNGILILISHEHRHINQALRVKQHKEFPF